jgi:asparagine synthase (glutamine-hydrolysing)
VSGPLAAYWGIPVTDVPADGLWPLKDYPAHGPDRDDPYLYVYQPLLDACLDAARADGCALVLSGDRGDEVAGDWIHDLPGLLLSGDLRAAVAELREIGRGRRRPLLAAARRELAPALRRVLGRATRARAGARHAPGSGGPPLPPRAPWVPSDLAARTGLEDTIRSGLAPGPGEADARMRRWQRITNRSLVSRLTAAERRAARAGLVAADPWSDRRLASFVVAIPQHHVNRATDRKRIVRRALRAVGPADVVSRLGKTEPASLFDAGFRGPGREVVLDLLRDPVAERRGYLDAGEARTAFRDWLDGKPVRHDFWWPVALEWWLRSHG